MTLADKICNLRDMVASPPQGWSLERCVELRLGESSRRWIAAREFRSDQGVRRSVREEDGRSELALGEGVQGRPDYCQTYGQTTARLLGPAISKTPRCREGVRPTARIARARACDLTATEFALCRYTRCGLQSRNIPLYSRLFVCEVGLLARDTCSGDKTIGARRTAWHCLAISLRSRSLRRDERSQKQA
jgi:hypothetical protein